MFLELIWIDFMLGEYSIPPILPPLRVCIYIYVFPAQKGKKVGRK